MLSFKVIVMLLWTFAATAVLSHAAAIPSTEQWRRADELDSSNTEFTNSNNTTNFTRPPQNCTGPEAIGSNEFLQAGVPALTESCVDLLRKLQSGGRTTFVQGGTNGLLSDDGMCGVFWTSGEINAAGVSFDDLVAPLAVALARGSRPDGLTVGEIKNYRLAGVCTDIRIGLTD